jgi:cobalamin biosynthesis protein CobT
MAAQRLAPRPEERKILCVINDGAPASHGVPFDVLRGGLCDTIRTITRAGIEVWGIGAGTDSPKHFYNESTGARNVCINNLETMAPTLLSLFSKRIEAPA